MKKLLYPFVVLWGIQALYAQQDISLPGVVVEQNSKYKTGTVHYLSKVSLRSIPSSTPTQSDDIFHVFIIAVQYFIVSWTIIQIHFIV